MPSRLVGGGDAGRRWLRDRVSDRNDPGEAVTPDEVLAVTADLRLLRDRPPPSDPTAGGCVVAIVAIITLVLMPFIGRALTLSGGAMLAFGLGLGAMAVVGGLIGIFGGGLVRGAVAGDVDQAIDEVVAEYPRGDEGRYREAAIRILDGAYVSTGPTTVHTFDREEVADRLGEALPYVERIERILLVRSEIYAVFTLISEDEDLD